MKKSTFVSFSTMIQKKIKPSQDTSAVKEPEVDYESLYRASIEENESLKEQIAEIEEKYSKEKVSLEQEKTNFQAVLTTCEAQVITWKNEMREHIHSVWTSFLQQLIQDPAFHQLAVHDMIAEAVLELGEQKHVHVDVPVEFLETAKKLLSGREGWTVSSMDDLTLGVRFSQEQVYWKTELEPVFHAFFEALEKWVKEKE